MSGTQDLQATQRMLRVFVVSLVIFTVVYWCGSMARFESLRTADAYRAYRGHAHLLAIGKWLVLLVVAGVVIAQRRWVYWPMVALLVGALLSVLIGPPTVSSSPQRWRELLAVKPYHELSSRTLSYFCFTLTLILGLAISKPRAVITGHQAADDPFLTTPEGDTDG